MPEDANLNITFKCPKCGGTVISVADKDSNDSAVTCKSCGVGFGTWGDIKKQAADAAKKFVVGDFKASMKKAGWKV
jgi:transcription elongation factor Elf1